jgi:riboflavin kinase / FMN adenylyltransferase
VTVRWGQIAPDWTTSAEESNSVAVSSRRVFGTANYVRRSSSLVAIGNFDGVHPGHRSVLDRAVNEAGRRSLAPLVLTFSPHPAEVLGRGALPVLTTLERKIALILASDPSLVTVVEPFTEALSRWTPAEFAERILVERLDARVVIVGENFRFGHDRTGDLDTLRALGRKLGFEARAEPLVSDTHGPYSSTRVRRALKDGDVRGAEESLGRPHSLSGTVVHGNARGRTIGVPTANLAGVLEALPPYGVYASLVDRADANGGGTALARGVMNLGVRPTLESGFSVEVHLLDFEGDLYGALLRVHLVERLRDERRFADLSALKERISADIEEARRVLAPRSPDPSAGGAWA